MRIKGSRELERWVIRVVIFHVEVRIRLICLSSIGMGLCVGVGCRYYAENHCFNLDGDMTCAERGGYCSACEASNDGCVRERPSVECYFPGPLAGTSGTSSAEMTSFAGTSRGQNITSMGADNSTIVVTDSSMEGDSDSTFAI